MKIFHINAVNYIASTGRTCFELNKWLNSNGHRCITAYSKGVSQNINNEYVIGSVLDTKLHGLFSRISGKQGYFSYFATKKLLAYMKKYIPDVVVLSNLHGNYINLPMLLKYLAKNNIPTVAILHDCWFYTGKCCHYTIEGCYKWQDICGDCTQLKKYNVSWFFDRTRSMHKDKIRLFNNIPKLAVIGVSDWILEEAKKSPVFKNAKIFKRIYNWIDTGSFSPKATDDVRDKYDLVGKKVVLAVASGWSKEKGIDTLIKISKQLKADEKLVIVGNLTNIELNENTLHIPATDSIEELAQLYSLADVFVQPSLEETFGKVSAEALACGTPIVCFNSTANPELAGDECGIVVDTDNSEKMIESIRSVFKKDKEFYIEKCRSFAENNFDMNTNIYEYVKVYNVLNNLKNEV